MRVKKAWNLCKRVVVNFRNNEDVPIQTTVTRWCAECYGSPEKANGRYCSSFRNYEKIRNIWNIFLMSSINVHFITCTSGPCVSPQFTQCPWPSKSGFSQGSHLLWQATWINYSRSLQNSIFPDIFLVFWGEQFLWPVLTAVLSYFVLILMPASN